jgi:inhibitor of cysteine peptidase
VGDTIKLSLPENPTTGYRWAIIGNGAPICEVKTDDFSPGDQKPGAGGTRSLAFAVRKAGEATITLRNQRKWGDADSGHDFTLNVRAVAPN